MHMWTVAGATLLESTQVTEPETVWEVPWLVILAENILTPGVYLS